MSSTKLESPTKRLQLAEPLPEQKPAWVYGDIEGKLDSLRNSHKTLEAAAAELGLEVPDLEKSTLGSHVNVFIGDVLDKGEWNIDMMELLDAQLEDNKQRKLHRNHNIFIVGNRDINKMRLWFELLEHGTEDTDCLNMTLENSKTFRVPGWRQDWEKYLAQRKAADPNFHYSNGSENRFKDMVIKADFLFEKTLGCPGMLAKITAELNRGRDPANQLSTSDALFRYLEYFNPKRGLFIETLKLGRIIRVRDGTLYVHGGITGDNYIWIPPSEVGKAWRKASSFTEWILELQTWYEIGISNYQRGYLEKVIPLFEYQEPPVDENGNWLVRDANLRSVVHARFYTPDFQVACPPQWVIEDLRANGIKRIVHGHSPVGDIALYHRFPALDFEIVSTDTSASSCCPSLCEISPDRVRILGEVKIGSDAPILVKADSEIPGMGEDIPGQGILAGISVKSGQKVFVNYTKHPAGFLVPQYTLENVSGDSA